MSELAASTWARPLTVLALFSMVSGCGQSRDETAVESTSGIATSSTPGSISAPSVETSTVTPPPNTEPGRSTEAASGDEPVPGTVTTVPGTVTTVPRTQPRPLDPQGITFAGAFGAFVGGGDTVPDCEGEWDVVPSTPYIGPGSGSLGTLIRGVDLQICFAGFDLTSAIELTVVDPSGGERILTVSAGSTDIGPTELLVDAVGDVPLLAGDGYVATNVGQLDPTTPIGQYRLTARQGDLEAEVTPTVEPYPVHDPDGGWLKPQLDLAARPNRHAGDTIRILLLGFEADASVPLAVYRPEGLTAEGVQFAFVKQLPDAQVNAEGWGYEDVVIPADLPPMTEHPGYCIVTLPALAPPYCQPDLDPVFTLSGDAPPTTGADTTEASTTTETTTAVTAETSTAATSTTVVATTAASPTTSQTTTSDSAPP